MSALSDATEFMKSTLRRLKRIEDWIDRFKNFGGSGSGPGGGKAIVYATLDSTNPPTETELEAAFGSPAGLGTNFLGLLNDAAGGTSEYLVMCDGTTFWYQALTKPITGPPIPPVPPANADLTYIFANGKVARARNFITGGSSVHYEDATGVVTGTGTGTAFVCDRQTPKQIAYRLFGDVLEQTLDLDSTIPTWAPILTVAAVQSAVTLSGLTLMRVDASHVEPGVVAIGWTNTARWGVSVSTDYGATWAHHDIGASNGFFGRFEIDTHLAGVMYAVTGNGSHPQIQKSTDYGATWGGILGPSFTEVIDFDVAYPNNGSVIVGRVVPDHMHYSVNAGGSFTDAGAVISPQSNAGGYLCMNIAYQDDQDVLWAEQTGEIWHSADGGATWSSLGSPYGASSSAADQNFTSLMRWQYDANQCFWLWAPGGASPPLELIGYSSNLMGAIQNKVGDWVATFGAGFDHPVAIVPIWLV